MPEQVDKKLFLTMRKGRKGPGVKQLQRLLNEALKKHPPLKVDGDFGEATRAAVKQYQKSKGLKADGVVGPTTWSHLVGHRPETIATPQERQLPSIAAAYLGARETGANRMGTDPRMKRIFEADDLAPRGKTDGYPWCAAFVSLCVQELVRRNPGAYLTVTPPREPSVNRFLTRWAPSQDCLIFAPGEKDQQVRPGDIVVFRFSHIGIVQKVGAGAVTTIEGNTNAAGSREGVEVARKTRRFSQIRKFIRLPLAVGDFKASTETHAYA